MIAKAHARFIRISPRKMRQVVNTIKGKSVYEALAILTNMNKRAAVFAEDVLKSAMSNARRNPDIKDENLFISKMIVNGGPMFKRYKAASMGRATMIRHRTSHLMVELDLMPVKMRQIKDQERKIKEKTKKAKKRTPSLKAACKG